jgi:hypothetical protein
MPFFFFLLVNAALFIRPAELVPALVGWKIYEPLILLCAVTAVTEVLGFLTGGSSGTKPITLCIFGLLLVIILSFMSRFEMDKAVEKGIEFTKVLVYYLLLVSIVNTPERLRRFLFWITLFCAAMTLLAVLRYHDVIEIKRPEPPPSFDPRDAGRKKDTDEAFVKETVWDPVMRQEVEVKRLRGTGIFQDPNDICLALAIAIPLTLFWLTDPRLGAARVLWIGPLLLFCWALYHTHSRGGLMGCMAGMLALFNARYGWRKTLALTVPVLPVLLVIFAGRMTNIDLDSSKSTGQSRIQLWSAALDEFRAAPLLGIGMGELGTDMSHVAHNSFIQCFMDLGIVGGTLFLGAFYCAVAALRRVGSGRVQVVNLEMWRLRPYLLAVVVGASVCMLSLTLSYLVPTYMILGLVTAYVAVAVRRSPQPVLVCDLALIRRLVTVSVIFLAVAYVFVRVMVRWA